MKRRRWPWVLAIVLVGTAGLEFGLRWGLGLGNPPLYVESGAYEYIQAPGQDVVRFGNRVITNRYSMRSAGLRPDACPIVMFIGDSVVNGGAPTDQAELATTLIEERLRAGGFPRAQTLNISAGSWGPDNAAAYLEQQGLFGAELMVAVFSSHDAADMMDFRPTVGVHPSYPDEKPVTAIGELLTRYLWPRAKALVAGGRSETGPSKAGAASLNPGWLRLVTMADSTDVPLRLYLHPDRSEARTGRFGVGGQRIQSFAADGQIVLWNGIDMGMDTTGYRDPIHLNAEGQRQLADLLYPRIAELLRANGTPCGLQRSGVRSESAGSAMRTPHLQ